MKRRQAYIVSMTKAYEIYGVSAPNWFRMRWKPVQIIKQGYKENQCIFLKCIKQHTLNFQDRRNKVEYMLQVIKTRLNVMQEDKNPRRSIQDNITYIARGNGVTYCWPQKIDNTHNINEPL
jgi:guanylate kinase